MISSNPQIHKSLQESMRHEVSPRNNNTMPTSRLPIADCYWRIHAVFSALLLLLTRVVQEIWLPCELSALCNTELMSSPLIEIQHTPLGNKTCEYNCPVKSSASQNFVPYSAALQKSSPWLRCILSSPLAPFFHIARDQQQPISHYFPSPAAPNRFALVPWPRYKAKEQQGLSSSSPLALCLHTAPLLFLLLLLYIAVFTTIANVRA